MNPQADNTDKPGTIEEIELNLLLEAIHQRYGYDFREYSRAHIRRRILSRVGRNGMSSISELQGKILVDEELFHALLLDLSLNVTEMFRDPKFFAAFRRKVVPILRTWPFLKIWHAGCATGEELYSMAILLKEEGLYDRSLLYGTDFNQIVLSKANEGIFPADRFKLFSENYQLAGGTASLSDYFTIQYDSAIPDQSLRKNILFSDHNLVTDGVFGEMNVVICRNVLIYFNRQLQNKVFRLFYDSILPGGFLCLGSKETIAFSDFKDKFEMISRTNIFKRKYD